MSNALMSGVTGIQAHQQMLDVSGNNLANVNTYGFKSSRVTFAELMAQTTLDATQPTEQVGGTNPQQIGLGVAVGSIDRNMSQGSLVNTGQPLDMAMEGAGYFILHDGEKDVYTRVGTFAVDAEYYLVDPGTGYRVQRIGSEGVEEGFQEASSDFIRIPYDVALPSQATETVAFSGNLSADAVNPEATFLSSGTQYTESGAVAHAGTRLADLDQASSVAAGDVIRIYGTDRGGAAVDTNLTLGAASTLGDLVAAINAAYTGSTASLGNGEIRLIDDDTGYSLTDVNLEYTGGGTLEVPNYFKMLAVGGTETRNTNVEVFDQQGIGRVMSVAFVRTDTPDTWDAVLTNITGDVLLDDRRIRGMTFGRDGSFGGPGGSPPDDISFSIRYGATGDAATIDLDLGTIGEFDGLSQFGGASTVAAAGQDGYEAGYLSSLSVSREGVLVGMFTNGVRRDVAALRIGTFQNPAALESVGRGYYVASGNSGDAVSVKALQGGAGAVRGGSLERSNVEVAREFVNLIQAQNGFQASARTIRVTSDVLRELANLIR